MAWNYDRSRERIRAHLDGLGEIEIKKLVREANLDDLLTETQCREIYGAHVYVDISNFSRLASEEFDSDDDYRRLIQAVHLYQREVSRIIEAESAFDSYRVHFQGPRVHALIYRPINDGETQAIRAVLLQLVLKDFVRTVFNPEFSALENFTIAGGAHVGDVVGTRNGTHGDRELLFLGAPANYAAKIISIGGRLRLTQAIYDLLPNTLQDLCEEVDDELFQLESVSSTKLDELLDEYDVDWDREASRQRLRDDKRQFPLKGIEFSAANVLIGLDALSIRNNKRVTGASLYADVSGFTAFIDEAETEEDRKLALRAFHAIRRELAQVVRSDFDGLRIQYQGDRVQALFHLPKDDEEAIATEAVEAAVGLQSSMERSLKDCLANIAGVDDLHLAIGVDIGTTLVSKLGSRAHRDRICLGEAVQKAAQLEERCEGTWIGISRSVYDGLPGELREHFHWNDQARCYVGKGLTVEILERSKRAREYDAGAAAFLRSEQGSTTISGQETAGARRVEPPRPWAPSGGRGRGTG